MHNESDPPLSDSATEDITVWVIEDSPRFKKRLVKLLDKLEGICCTFSTAHCEEAVRKVHHGERPDVILMDIRMPGMSGIDGTLKIRELDSSIYVIALTVSDKEDDVTAMLLAGASGYLLKPSTAEEIMDAIKEVRNGGSPLTPSIATMVLNFFRRYVQPKRLAKKKYKLSGRELEILEWLTKGKTKNEVAELTSTSSHTVDTHIRHIYKKLDVHNRSGAIAKAIKEGILPPNE